MSILVNPHNEQEEKVLIAFLNSMKYDYKPTIGSDEKEVMRDFLDQYNKEIDEAEAEIDAGDYLDQDEVEAFFANRRKSHNGDKMEQICH
jgi:hypothetical protein